MNMNFNNINIQPIRIEDIELMRKWRNNENDKLTLKKYSNREIFLDFRKHKKLYIPRISSEKNYGYSYGISPIVKP